MKRYVLTAILLVLALAGIGAYYAYAASDRLPEYKLETIEGNAQEGENITLSGWYGGRMRSQFMEVSAEGSEYSRDKSFFTKNFSGRRSWILEDPEFSKLIQEHRQFMRGTDSFNSLYSDKEWLIYTEASAGSPLTFKLDLLELRSGTTKRYSVVPADQSGKSNSYVMDVQRIGNELHMLTFTVHISERQKAAVGSEYNDYVVDLSTGNFIRKVSIDYGIAPKKGVALYENLITAGPFAAPGTYALFKVHEEQVIEGKPVNNGSRVYLYSYKTGKLTPQTGNLIEKVLQSNVMSGMNGERFYVMTNGEQTTDLYRFDLATGKQIGKKTTITARQFGADKLGARLLRADRIYILLHKNNIPQVAVISAEDGTVLYKGETKFMGPASDAKKQMGLLTLRNFQIKG